MAKKQKRNVSQSVAVNQASPASPAARTTSYSNEFNPDYGYVIADLKKIGILAVTFISLLVVISFFLR